MRINITNENILAFIMFIPSISQILKVSLNMELQILPIALFVISFLIAIYMNRNNERSYLKHLVLFFIIDILLWSYSFIINFDGDMNILLRMLKQHFLFIVPIFIISTRIRSFGFLEQLLIRYAKFFSFLYLILSMLCIRLTIKSTYDMSLGYILIFITMILISDFINKHNIVSLFLVIFNFSMALKYGSRGVVAVLFVFLFINIFYLKFKYKIYSIFISVVGFCFLYLLNLRGMFENSRTIRLILDSDTFFYFSGRDKILDTLLPYTDNAIILGNGIGFDRIVNNNYGLYAHNIFVELIVQLGWMIPFWFLLVSIYYLYKIYKLNKMRFSYVLVVFFSLSTSLFFSGSVWTSMNFWVFVGLCYSYLQIYGKNKILE